MRFNLSTVSIIASVIIAPALATPVSSTSEAASIKSSSASVSRSVSSSSSFSQSASASTTPFTLTRTASSATSRSAVSSSFVPTSTKPASSGCPTSSSASRSSGPGPVSTYASSPSLSRTSSAVSSTTVTITRTVTLSASSTRSTTTATSIPSARSIEVVFTEDAAVPVGPSSQAIISGEHMYIAGYLALSPATGGLVGEGDIVAQTFATLGNIRTIVDFSGSTLDRVVKITLYLQNISDLQVVSRIISGFFHGHRPVMSVVAVENLPLNALVEMDAIVRMP